MKRTLYSLIAIANLGASRAFAAENWIGISNDKLRNGNVGFNDIPAIIINVTNYILGLAGTVTVVMIIYGAVRMGLGSLSNDKETGKKIISAGIVGFVLAVSGWFIIRLVIENL
jgi:hypothetical protein